MLPVKSHFQVHRLSGGIAGGRKLGGLVMMDSGGM